MERIIIDKGIVKQKINELGILSVCNISIRELVKLVDAIEKETGYQYIRMELGVPGIKACSIGVDAEIEALKNGYASVYSNIEGIPELKNELSRFSKLFLNITVSASSCIPTVGGMQASFAAFIIANRTDKSKGATLFIDPGFSVQKQQIKTLGFPYISFDIYNFRGEKLREKLESYLTNGIFSSIIYSNPNNPTWICFTNQELQIIGEVASKYDVIVIEDLAYIGMDFREDFSLPGQAPYPPTVANYTNNYILLISASKIFSFAGERLGAIVVSDDLINRNYSDLKQYFGTETFGNALIYGALYPMTASTSHAGQYAFATMLKTINDGEFNYVNELKIYGEQAKVMKRLFTENGFYIVYEKDDEKPLADGFYFTFCYPGLTGKELSEELLYYGISAISLKITGSDREGLRACVSLVHENLYGILEKRLKQFNEDHPINK